MHSRIKTQYSQEKINHLVFKDDIKLFAKNKRDLETLIQTVRIYCQDIEMELGMEKYDMQAMKSGKRDMTEGIKLLNQEKKSEPLEKRKLKILGNIES